jgi:hypothetical protein
MTASEAAVRAAEVLVLEGYATTSFTSAAAALRHGKGD